MGGASWFYSTVAARFIVEDAQRPFYQHDLTETSSRIDESVHCFFWYVITDLCPNPDDCLTKQPVPLKSGYRGVITSHNLHECDCLHYDDVIMTTIPSQITSLTVVYSTVYSGAVQIKQQSSASLAFVWGSYRGPVNSPHKWPVTRKMIPFDDVIISQCPISN